MNKRVLAAGHICMDITPIFPSDKVSSVAQLLRPGQLIEMGSADVHTGGSVANTGLAMKLLGADAALMGKLGKDEFGDMVMQILDSYGASGQMLRSEDVTTSYSVVLAIPGIDRIFLHHPGANNSFSADDIPVDTLKETALFHFGYPTLMEKMYIEDGAELERLFQMVHEAGVATSLDLAAVDANSAAGQKDWRSILKRVLPYVDFFLPSIEELCFMLDRNRYTQWQQRNNDGDITETLDICNDIEPLAEQCMELGCKTLLLKCGAPGMYFRSSNIETLSRISDRIALSAEKWADKSIFERSYVPDKVLSTTGAGDTCIAAFLTAMLDGYSPEDCLRLATATGACCVTAYDALSGLLPFDKLWEKINSGWEKRS